MIDHPVSDPPPASPFGLSHEEIGQLTTHIEAAISSAWAAWNERPDLYEDPGNSRVLAELATQATLKWFERRGARSEAPMPAPQVLAAKVAGLSYKDWTFSLVQLPGGQPAVRVAATLDNTFHPNAPFRTTQIAAIDGDDVVGAARRAVVQIEEHEVDERLRYNGTAVLDPHAADRVPAPTNERPA